MILGQLISVDSQEEVDRRFLFRDYPHAVYHGDVHGRNRRPETRYTANSDIPRVLMLGSFSSGNAANTSPGL